MHVFSVCSLQDDEDDDTATQPELGSKAEVKAEPTTERSSNNGGSNNGAGSSGSSTSNGGSSSSATTNGSSSSSSSSSSGKRPAAAPRRASPPSSSLAAALQDAREEAIKIHTKGSTVEDFQAGLLQWDILAELRAEVTDTRKAFEAAHREDFSNITVPDHFASFAEYLSVWKPLCLREARAQTLNALISDAPTDDPAQVRLRVSAIADSGGDLCCMDLQVIEDRGGSSSSNSGGSTAAKRAIKELRGGELLLFTRDKDTLSKLLALQRGGATPVAATAYSSGATEIVS
jgi:hypothetical protein